MQQPVQDRRRYHLVVGEDIGPLGVGLIRGQNHGAMFVSLADDIEEQRGLLLVERREADFVDDEQRRSCVGFQTPRIGVALLGFLEPGDHRGAGGELDAMPAPGRLDAQSNRQMGLAGARRAQQDDVSAVPDVTAFGEFPEYRRRDAFLEAEVEVLERFPERERRHAQHRLPAAHPGKARLLLQELCGEPHVGPVVGSALLGDGVDGRAYIGQAYRLGGFDGPFVICRHPHAAS